MDSLLSRWRWLNHGQANFDWTMWVVCLGYVRLRSNPDGLDLVSIELQMMGLAPKCWCHMHSSTMQRNMSVSSGQQLSWNWRSSATGETAWHVAPTDRRCPQCRRQHDVGPELSLGRCYSLLGNWMSAHLCMCVKVWVPSVRYDSNQLKTVESVENWLASTDRSNWCQWCRKPHWVLIGRGEILCPCRWSRQGQTRCG